MKTYLINQNGETIIKQIKSKPLQNKISLEQKLHQRKQSIQKSQTKIEPIQTIQPNFINT